MQAKRAHRNAIKAPLSARIERTIEHGCTVMQLPCNEDGSPVEDLCLPEDTDNNNAANLHTDNNTIFMSVTASVLHIVPAVSVVLGLALLTVGYTNSTTKDMLLLVVALHMWYSLQLTLNTVFALQLLHVLCNLRDMLACYYRSQDLYLY